MQDLIFHANSLQKKKYEKQKITNLITAATDFVKRMVIAGPLAVSLKNKGFL